jgi:hypothetical protein
VAAEVGTVLTPAELLEAVRDRGYGWLKSPRGLAGLMAPLGFVARHTREGGRRGRFYLLDPPVLTDLATRYTPGALEGVGAAARPRYQKSVTSVDKRCKRYGDGHLRNFREALTRWHDVRCKQPRTKG